MNLSDQSGPYPVFGRLEIRFFLLTISLYHLPVFVIILISFENISDWTPSWGGSKTFLTQSYHRRGTDIVTQSQTIRAKVWCDTCQSKKETKMKTVLQQDLTFLKVKLQGV